MKRFVPQMTESNKTLGLTDANLELELHEAFCSSREQITWLVLEMADGCEQSTSVKNKHCANLLFGKWPLMGQQKMKKVKSLKCWKFKFKANNEDIKQHNNPVFNVLEFGIDMWFVHHEEMLHKNWNRKMKLCELIRHASQAFL